MQKPEKSLKPFLRKQRYQPTNQPIITNNTDLIGPRWHRSKKLFENKIRLLLKKKNSWTNLQDLYYLWHRKSYWTYLF